MLQALPPAGSEQKKGLTRAPLQYFGLVPAAIVVAALYFGRPVLLPLAVAILIAFALAPVVLGLRHLGVGRTVSVLLSAIAAIGMLAVIGFFVGGQLVQLTDRLPQYQENLVKKIQAVRGSAMDSGVIGRASSMFRVLRDQVTDSRQAPNSDLRATTNPRAARNAPGQTQAPQAQASKTQAPVPVEIRQPDATPLDLFLNIVGPLVDPLAAAGIVLVFVIFILLHKEDIRDRFVRLAGSGDMQRTTLLLDEGAEKLSHYLLMQTAMNVSFGCVIGAGLWVIGIPNPILWGLMVTFFRFVPYIGVPVAAVFPIILALSVAPGWSMMLETMALFFASEIVVGQAIEPWLYGRQVGLSPVAIVVSATFWTWLWGPLGLLLSTPLTMCLVVLGKHVEHLQFLDVALGNRPPLAAEESLYLRLLGEDADEAVMEAEAFLKENSLCGYYNEVVLKALGLAQADVNRGALDAERVARIKETTQALIQDISEGTWGDADAKNESMKDPGANFRAMQDGKSVLCIGGRGPLDEAAALLLAHLLGERGIGARVLAGTEISAGHISALEVTEVKIVCLCYLDPGNLARARYLMRRIRRHMPEAKIIANFWYLRTGQDEIENAMGCEVVTELEQAVERIVAGGEMDPQQEIAVPMPEPRTRSVLAAASGS